MGGFAWYKVKMKASLSIRTPISGEYNKKMSNNKLVFRLLLALSFSNLQAWMFILFHGNIK
jgi:hypothetical protein